MRQGSLRGAGKILPPGSATQSPPGRGPFRVFPRPKEQPKEPLVPAVSIKKSVQPDYIVCLEDGKKFQSPSGSSVLLPLTTLATRGPTCKWRSTLSGFEAPAIRGKSNSGRTLLIRPQCA